MTAPDHAIGIATLAVLGIIGGCAVVVAAGVCWGIGRAVRG